ncbi:MAG: thioredoxin family protein [Bacteroidales bacterium]|nr:thioredoxin family protein [Bacteroidales bacterium]
MNYQEAIKQPGIVLIEFYATWCPHCQHMEPIMEELEKELAGKVKIFRYDIDQHKECAEKAGVETIPTFFVYKNGVETFHHSGELTAEQLLSQV